MKSRSMSVVYRENKILVISLYVSPVEEILFRFGSVFHRRTMFCLSVSISVCLFLSLPVSLSGLCDGIVQIAQVPLDLT